MAKTLCRVLGIILLVVGIIGFMTPNLLGMHLSVPHNVVHLISGALAVYFGFSGTVYGARTFSLIFGAVYTLLGILGFVAPMTVASLLQMHEAPGPLGSITPDNMVHLLLGVVFLVAWYVRSPQSTAIPT